MTESAGTSRKQKTGRGARALLPHALALAGALAAALLLYHEVLGYALVGHDTYPIILTARIRTAADFAGTFTEELMDGRYTQGHFYRPVLNLSFAIDYALYGLRPWGYHLTDLLLLACTALLIARIPRGGRRTVGAAGIAAGILFLIHPAHLNVLPVPARRGDVLSIAFTALALLAARRGGRAGRWGPALFTLLAVGAKESGAMAPVLLMLQALFDPPAGRPRRLRGAFRAAALPALFLAMFLLSRGLVLGGVGGHGEIGAGLSPRQALLTAVSIYRHTFYPYAIFGSALPPGATALVLLAGFAAASLLLLGGREARGPAMLAWSWLLAGAAVHVFALSLAPWYALHAVAAFAILSGLLLRESIRRGRAKGRRAAKLGAALIGAMVLALCAANLRNAPPFGFHPEWRDATRKTDRFLAGLDKDVAAALPGTTIEAPDLPFVSRARPGSPIAIVASLADYSVQAWAELTFPGKKIRVAFPDPLPPPPADDEILVVVTPGR